MNYIDIYDIKIVNPEMDKIINYLSERQDIKNLGTKNIAHIEDQIIFIEKVSWFEWTERRAEMESEYSDPTLDSFVKSLSKEIFKNTTIRHSSINNYKIVRYDVVPSRIEYLFDKGQTEKIIMFPKLKYDLKIKTVLDYAERLILEFE